MAAEQLLDLEGEFMKTADGDCVADMHYRLDDMSLIIALSNGDILSWSDHQVSMK